MPYTCIVIIRAIWILGGVVGLVGQIPVLVMVAVLAFLINALIGWSRAQDRRERQRRGIHLTESP